MRWSGLSIAAALFALAGCGTKYALEDVDGDGYTALDGDCWDSPASPDGSDVSGASIHPGAPEIWYDGVDEDCAGDDDFDQDGDGFASAAAGVGGLDCDDLDATVYPGAPDAWYDGVDSDCAGDDDLDQDRDGHDAVNSGGDDCDDTVASTYPGAADAWYDGVDSDCAGDDDFDQDGDSYRASSAGGPDCDDLDPAINPDTPEIWYNRIDENCDGNDGDQDGDGYVSEDYAEANPDWEAINPGLLAGDCWDDPDNVPGAYVPLYDYPALTADQVSPGAGERYYDGVDQNCDEADDFDADGDTFETADHPDAIGVFGDDCDDADGAVYPGAADAWYDGIDSDCAGDDDFDADRDGVDLADDCDDTDAAISPSAAEIWYNGVDENCDGNDGDKDGDGYVPDDYAAAFPDWATISPDLSTGDCWDDPDALPAGDEPLNGFDALTAEEVNPGAEERTYDGIDQDCAGDDDFDQDGDLWDSADYPDADGVLGEDCDDADASISPGATETWYDGIDSDCAGDDDFDADGDGHDLVGFGSSDDCDDSAATVYFGAEETCASSVDENCDGDNNDPNAVGCTEGYLDADGDSYGVADTLCTCVPSGEYTADNATDCDDADPTVLDTRTWYTDADGDGYGDSTSSFEVCDAPEGTVASADDCDDGDPAVNPGTTEICDDANTDEDCNGLADDLDPSADPSTMIAVYTDADGDGYGDPATALGVCDPPTGHVLDATDCDDGTAAVSPGAIELTGDGIDEDCDGGELCYADADVDGVRTDTTVRSADADCLAAGEALETVPSGDCDDANDTIYPGASELVGDEVDEDCDGGEICYEDADGDGYRTSSTVVSTDASCADAGEAPASATDGDCDEGDAAIHPDALELCDNVDQDCDGHVLDVNLDSGGADFSTEVLRLSRATGDALVIADDPALDFGGGSWTLEAWVNASDYDAGTGAASVRLLDRTDGAYPTDAYWALNLDDIGGYGVPRVEVAGWSDGALHDGTTSSDDGYAANTWFHVAAVVDTDANTATYYINGETTGPLDLPSGFAGSDVSDSAPLLISSLTAPFDGMIDEIRIWDLARSQTLIQGDMCQTISSDDADYPDLILYLPLETGMADDGPYGLTVAAVGSPELIPEP